MKRNVNVEGTEVEADAVPARACVCVCVFVYPYPPGGGGAHVQRRLGGGVVDHIHIHSTRIVSHHLRPQLERRA